MSDNGHDLIVIGGGEAGISAALRATELGAKVLLINREPELGGGCVQTGTLPSQDAEQRRPFPGEPQEGQALRRPVVENARADYKAILDEPPQDDDVRARRPGHAPAQERHRAR